MPAEDYEVQEGDCVSSIAFSHGFFWETLWNLGSNSELKSKRKDPNILQAGDILHIPELTPRDESGATEKKHRFKLKGVPAKLKLKLMRPKADKKPSSSDSGGASAPGGGGGLGGGLGGALSGLASSLPSIPGVPGMGGGGSANSNWADPDFKPPPKLEEEPIANADYVFEADGSHVSDGKTDQDGCVEIPLVPNAREGKLIIDRGKPTEKIIQLDLGGMDPLAEVSGVRKRLRNLGFFCRPDGPDGTPDLKAALKRFQDQNSLDTTGEIDDATRDKLKEVHGS